MPQRLLKPNRLKPESIHSESTALLHPARVQNAGFFCDWRSQIGDDLCSDGHTAKALTFMQL